MFEKLWHSKYAARRQRVEIQYFLPYTANTYQVHDEVQLYGKVRYKEQCIESVLVIGTHHHIWIAEKHINSQSDFQLPFKP